MADYLLGELAELSGVSARNIRAYRERGLLDPPRRQGRAALYDDRHLAQLTTINDLLGKGYTSAHIAQFFETMRQGHDLADILGLQTLLFGDDHRAADGRAAGNVDGRGAGNVDPTHTDVRRLVERGLAREGDGDVHWPDSRLAEILGSVADPSDYLRTMLRVSDGVSAPIDEVAAAVVIALRTGLVERWGTGYVPRPEDRTELNRIVGDYRRLADRVIAAHLDMSLRRQLVQAMTDYTSRIVVSGGQSPTSDTA